MKRITMGLAIVLMVGLSCRAEDGAEQTTDTNVTRVAARQAPAESTASSDNDTEAAIREVLRSYIEAFNEHDPAAVGKFWTADGVSMDETTGEKTEGRDAIVERLTNFFKETPESKLSGQVESVKMIRPDVASVEGQATVFLGDEAPIDSMFTAIFVKEGDGWLISSSHERDLPTPASNYEALQELEWLVGTWQDQSEAASVNTTVRWSPNQAFLIRSFSAEFPEVEGFQGTQVIGWDPLSKQIRTWTFNSDGSFGEGTISKSGDGWLLKMWQVLGDGSVANATLAMNRKDDNTMTIQTIGKTINGEPVPASETITVVRSGETAVANAEEGDSQ